MELAVLGAGVYLASALLDQGKQIVVDPTENEMQHSMLETPREALLHQYREYGAPAPSFNTTRGRLPWDPNFPPYYVSQTAPGGPNEDPVSRVHTLIANGIEHERQDVQATFNSARAHHARKRGGAVWYAFNDELTLDDADPSQPPRNTNRLGFSWLPANPTDSDYNEAGLIANALPGDPMLFTPDATYMTNSGMPFRHGYAQ